MNALRITLCSIVLLISTVPMNAQGTYTQIDVPGAFYGTEVSAINSAGDIIGLYVDASASWHGFLLSGGVYTTIDYPGATYTYLNGINDLGQIVGFGSPETSGFQYDVQTQSFTTITCPHAFDTLPYAINNNGVIAGTIRYQNFFYGFEITASSPCTHIAPPGTDNIFVSALTAKGGVVGNVNGMGSRKYFVWNGAYKPLSIPSALEGQLNAVNPAGTAVVGYYTPSSGVTAGFLYQNGTLTTLQFPGSVNTLAFGINSSGVVVGYFVDASNATHGFTWTPSGAAPEP